MSLIRRLSAALLCAVLFTSPATATTIDRIGGVSTSVAVKAPVRFATSANITLSGEQTINGVALVTGDRVLVTSQTDSTKNGIYDVSTSAWLRATDFDGARDAVLGTLVWAGADNAHPAAFWQLTTADPVIIGISSITFVPADVYEADISKSAAQAAATSAQTQANIANNAATSAATSASSAATSATTASSASASASSSASAASSSASSASSSASSASASASTAAVYAAGLNGTSSTSITIATGSQVFTTQSGKQFASGTYVIVASAANVTNYMHGQVTSYSGTALTVNVTDVGGSGTFSDWLIAVSGSRGATGAAGASGAGTGDMLAANNLSDLANKATARTNLLLGTGDTVTHDKLALNNSTNQIVLDADATNTGTITMSSLSAARTWTLPNKSGTYAMTSDVPTVGTSAGNVIALDGSAKLPAVDGSQLTNLPSSSGAVKVLRIQTFTSSGTYTPDAHIVYAVFKGVGGGASGGSDGHAGGGGTGGGGGSGACGEKVATAATIGTSQSVTIGAGGASVLNAQDANGNNGGTTSVGTLLSLPGGQGGAFGIPTQPAGGGAGGTPTTADVGIRGRAGKPGWGFSSATSINARSGDGGDSCFGTGGIGGAGNLLPITAAVGYGSGGAGSTPSAASGAGMPGEVVVYEYCSQ